MGRPIAMFDSGFGGLTVARAVIDLLPADDLVYFGDTGRYPYGPRTHDEVQGFALQISDWMISEFDPKILVVACNTAAAVALEDLQDRYELPVIGVLKPGLDSLLAVTASGRVGVIGTVGTIASGAYQRPPRPPHHTSTSRALHVPDLSSSSSEAKPIPSRSTSSLSGSWPRSSMPRSTPCCSVAPTIRSWRA